MMKKNILILAFAISAIDGWAQVDTSHYSSAFNAVKPYRIYLPENYGRSQQRFPVIYYLHGNNGTEKFYFDSLQTMVNRASVILVAWNGRSIPDDKRPYNAGYHSNINYEIQFKDYFRELVNHIDSSYRTLADRDHRAIIGHSMGGFMSFLLAGKYPYLVCAAVSSKGSPEFFVGYPQNHTLYQTRFMFKNLLGVRVRFQGGGEGEELHYLNKEVHTAAQRESGLDYEYREYPGTHNLKFNEFRDAFDFVLEAFRQPPPLPKRWHHADLYPNFTIWGYEVKSDLKEPGYIDMENVTETGLGIRTRRWQPDGPVIPGVNITVVTPPIYKPNTTYTLLDYDVSEQTTKATGIATDQHGSLRFETDGRQHQFGIIHKRSAPEIITVGYKVNDNSTFLHHNKESMLRLRLMNRGGNAGSRLTISISTSARGVSINNPVVQVENMKTGDIVWTPVDYKITAAVEPVKDGAPFRIRFNVVIKDEKGKTWNDEIDIPVWYDVPEFTEIGIDDGDSEIFGSGNGNNIAEPGETIMIYQQSNRTRLYYDDPYVENERLHDDLQPDKWGDGYALSSLIRISKDCPPGHVIRFLACYEIKEWKSIKRNVTWGVFSITVGKPEDKQE